MALNVLRNARATDKREREREWGWGGGGAGEERESYMLYGKPEVLLSDSQVTARDRTHQRKYKDKSFAASPCLLSVYLAVN